MIGKIRCWSTRNLLDLYADGRLTAGAAARVAEHIEDCEACRLEAEALLPLPASLAEKIEIPEGLTESILEKLEAGDALPAEPGLRELLRLEPAQALAMVYLAAVIGGHALPGTPSQALSRDAASVEVQR